ncbi:NAD(P)H-binding protein [Roseospira goensis]|uniref:Nucleoside-diphosphate-sugar epimerase n=1 Tax=Roseospira goensis TaxID=391922 RepID=A0A7W6WLT0_9PROT|nr:NAD(P)H-binding protein [Roseospira goensis]MBB4286742.1 nucleoside-diphosphate-sugar epimerase [Roseospira goensis]
MTDSRIAILGAGGPVGRHLAATLRARGHRLRLVGRDAARLQRACAAPEVERHATDLRDPAAAVAALADCAAAIDCVGPRTAADFAALPDLSRTLASAAHAAGCRLLHVTSTWSYLPAPALPVTADHPRPSGPAPARRRREAEDILQDTGAAIVAVPDLFGPDVYLSPLQAALRKAAVHEPMPWVGPDSVAREYAFVPDAARLIADLTTREAAFGERWLLPGSGPLTARLLADLVDAHLGRWVPVHTAGPTKIRLAALAVKALEDFLPLVPDYCRPIAYCGAKLEALLGPPRMTPYTQAIPATLDWLAANVAEPVPEYALA